MIAVRFASVTKRFGNIKAVNSVSLDIYDGELFFLLGPSGCGKTTLLRMLAGLSPPDEGDIYLGEQLVTNVPSQKRDCAMVFQSYALWPHMTVGENIAFGLGVRGIRGKQQRDQVREALAMVRLQGLEARRPAHLSGGQQQRVALARALVVKPHCLLLDEPLSNLDAKLRLEMRTEIGQLCRKTGLTAIYVTHDQKEAIAMADRVALMHEGRIVQCDEPRKFYRSPRTQFAAEFLGSINVFQALVLEREGSRVHLTTPMGRLSCKLPEFLEEIGFEDSSLGNRMEIMCGLRPEAVCLSEPRNRDSESICFSGEIVRSLFLGDMAQHVIRVNESCELQITELNPSVSLPRGSIKAWFHVDDLILMEDQ